MCDEARWLALSVTASEEPADILPVERHSASLLTELSLKCSVSGSRDRRWSGRGSAPLGAAREGVPVSGSPAVAEMYFRTSGL